MHHPVHHIEPEVSEMFQRAMTKADQMGRYMEPHEEGVHVQMSIAVSLKRIADAADRIGRGLGLVASSVLIVGGASLGAYAATISRGPVVFWLGFATFLGGSALLIRCLPRAG